MRQQRTLFGFLAIFIILVAVVLLQNPSNNSTDDSVSNDVATSETIPNELDFVQDLGVVFNSFSADDITAIRFEDPTFGDVITLSKDDDGTWRALEFSNAINQDIANALALTTTNLPYSETISLTDSTELGQYGLSLEGALLFIGIVLENNEQHSLVIGVPSPDSASHYVLVDAEETVYIIPRQPISFLLAYPSQMVSGG